MPERILLKVEAAMVGRISIDDALCQAVKAINQITGNAGETTRGGR